MHHYAKHYGCQNMNWLDAMVQLRRNSVAHVLVTIVAVDGSAPRDVGTKMVIDESSLYGTIGGGNLEHQAIKTARECLRSESGKVTQITYTLGEDLTQCCGGRVTLLFELFAREKLTVALFGAGHIGSAVAQILSEIDCSVQWFDTRADYPSGVTVKDHVQVKHMAHAAAAMELCGPDTLYLIMTHSHEIDFELVEAILSRGDARFCGLIASASKAAKFRGRLRRKKFNQSELDGLTAPVGLDIGNNKEPMAVAVSIVAQLLKLSEDIPSSSRQQKLVQIAGTRCLVPEIN